MGGLRKIILKQRTLSSFIWLGIMIVLAGCGSAAEADIATVAKTLVPPTAIQEPTATKTLIPPTATITPTLTEDPYPDLLDLFATPAYTYNRTWFTPTPLATPSTANYQLKEWSDEEAYLMVAKILHYARETDVEWFSTRSIYDENQYPVKIALQEALLRYPESEHAYELQWRQAVTDGLINEHDSEAWLIEQIEQALNHDEYSLETLEKFLEPYGFTSLIYFDEIQNLFGVGHNGALINVGILEGNGDEYFVIAVSEKTGVYELFPVHTTWGLDPQRGLEYYDDPIRIEDFTKDGVPELIMDQGFGRAGFQSVYGLIYQWDGKEFKDLARGQLYIGNSLDGDWRFSGKDDAGFEFIRVSNPYVYDELHWNGNYYEKQALPWFEYWDRFRNNKLLSSEFPQAIAELESILSDQARYEEEISGAILDENQNYIRMDLAAMYMLTGQVEKARATLTEIIEHPEETKYPPDLDERAEYILDHYHESDDLSEIFSASKLLSYELQQSEIYEYEVLEDVFSKKGLSIHEMQYVYLIQDHVPELILISKEGEQYHLWIFFPSQGAILVHENLAIDNSYPVFIRSYDDYPMLAYEPFSVTIMKLQDTVYIFKIPLKYEGLWEIDVLPHMGSHEDYWTFVWQETIILLQQDGVWKFYRWNKDIHDLAPIDVLGLMLFEQGDFTGAAMLAEEFLNNREEIPARTLYLWALAHELSGNESRAVELYLELWLTYPETGYAQLAEAKLEIVK